MNCLFKPLKLISFVLLFFVLLQKTEGQQTSTKFDIELENGKYFQIQACTDKIFRFRLQTKKPFTESLLERYNIVKSNWKQVLTNSVVKDAFQTIQIGNYQIIINTKNGAFSVNDNVGIKIIDHIDFSDGNSHFASELGKSLEKYFGKAKMGGGIIGDSNYTGIQTEFDEVGDSKTCSILEISLQNEERFYGGGNTSRKNIQHRGTALRMWATYQKKEIPAPFIMSSAGWGIYNNTTSKNYFDIGRFQNDKLFIYNTSGEMDFYLLLGKTMPEVIDLFTTVTGKPYLLPKWAYGLAFGGHTMEDQFDILNNAVRFRDEKIPCDIFWLEPQWMSKYYDFSAQKKWNQNKFVGETSWNEPYYPKSEGKTLFVSKLHALGFKLALWLCIDHDLSIEEEDHISLRNGQNQCGKEHWFDHLMHFMDQGVDGFKLDPGMTLNEHPDRKYFNGYTDKEMHNLNQVLLSKQMYTVFRNHKGVRSFHHYCGGYAGAQHWGASTSGDNGGGKDALFDQLNLGISGFVNTSADVLEGIDDNKAGLHLGFFLPWVQINSWYSMHHPWYLNPSEKETFKFYAQLRNTLTPYIYSAAIEGSQSGMPILRAMPLVFPEDRKVDNMIYQYMFGENLLVNVFSDSIYLPNGNWINYWTNEKLTGGKTVHCKIPENRGGLLFIKAGAIIPYQKPMQYIGEHQMDTLILKIFPEGTSSYNLYEDDGKSFEFENGKIATTHFECKQQNSKIEFCINPTVGSFYGQTNNRNIQLQFFLTHKPKFISINCKKYKNWKFDSAGVLMIDIQQTKITEKQLITIL